MLHETQDEARQLNAGEEHIRAFTSRSSARDFPLVGQRLSSL
jgi:hypothetical protein